MIYYGHDRFLYFAGLLTLLIFIIIQNFKFILKFLIKSKIEYVKFTESINYDRNNKRKSKIRKIITRN